LSFEERLNAEQLIRDGRVDVVFATSAFGMGMDLPQLRWVVLWQAPFSLLSLAQAAGRVGRAEERGIAWVYWDQEDFSLLEWAVRGSARKKKALNDLYSYLSGVGCRKSRLAQYFGVHSPHCGSCDFCLNALNPGHENNY
jgi:ATP-dependent DNA helicase RecQ